MKKKLTLSVLSKINIIINLLPHFWGNSKPTYNKCEEIQQCQITSYFGKYENGGVRNKCTSVEWTTCPAIDINTYDNFTHEVWHEDPVPTYYEAN